MGALEASHALLILAVLSVCLNSCTAEKFGLPNARAGVQRVPGKVDVVALDNGGGNEYSYSMYNDPQQMGRGARNAPTRNQQAGLQGLLKQASSASIGVLFALLAWRALTAYEMASHFKNGIVRLVSVSPSLLLLMMNLAGFLVNFFQPLGFKNHMKVILAANVSREWIELAYNFLMILVTDSTTAIPREVYFGRVFMNVWWTLLCMAFAKSRWVSNDTFKSQLERQQMKQQAAFKQQQQQFM